MTCDECGKDFEGGQTCPHCAREIAHFYESEVNPAAGGAPLAILGNLLIFLALLPVMLFAWSWMKPAALVAAAGLACHVLERVRSR
ncbi:MAG: hypothetical protein HY816_10875 [Candidatus Wallbacteria bacterium]|nr:hypothetical protein [Candidatus Wallbacteria bacterium]